MTEAVQVEICQMQHFFGKLANVLGGSLEEDVPDQPLLISNSDLWYGVKISTVGSFVLSQSTHDDMTNIGWIDEISTTNTRL